MDLNLAITLPGFLTGLVIGAAFSISRAFRVLTVTCIALLLIWIFYENGEAGIIDFFGSLHLKIITHMMFYLPSIVGIILGLILTKKLNK